MKHTLLYLLLALCSLNAYAQHERKDSIIVTGNVLDAYSRSYLDSVSVQLLSPISGEVLTSTFIHDHARDIEDEDYRKRYEDWFPIVRRRIYELKTTPGTYTLRFSRAGYKEKEQELIIPSRRYGRNTETWEVKDVLLNRALTQHLNEAVVKATKIKMMAKGDTVIYNADAFQLADGSMLDGLIAMMPGLEIRNGSQIYQNGEYIPELLLNGKDFFKGDATIALKNLPAYTVKDLRIYHRAPDDAYLRDDWTHEDTLRWGKVLDVRLKKQYNHGWITNAEIASGPAFEQQNDTQAVWLARLFGLHFTDHIRFGAFANINNVNDTELANSNGDWNYSWEPEAGVTTMKLGALDFSVDGKKTKINYNLNLQAVQETTDSETETSSTSFIPSGDVFNRSRHTNTFDRYHVVWNNTITWNAKKAHFFFKPGVDFFRRYNDGQDLRAQFSADPSDSYRGAALDSIFGKKNDGFLPLYSSRLQQMLVNRTSSLYSTREDFWWQVVRLGTSFKSPVTGNYISINLYQHYKYQTPENSNLYDLRTNSTSDNADNPTATVINFQNRYIATPSQNYYSSLNVNYYFHSFGKFKSNINYSYFKSYSKNNCDYYRLDRLDGEWADPNHAPEFFALPSTTDWRTLAIDADNTYRSKNNNDTHHIAPSLQYSGKFDFSINPVLDYNHEYHLDTRATQESISRRYVRLFAKASVNFHYKPIGAKSDDKQRGNLNFNYSVGQNTPSISYLLNVRDASDPLRVTLGNPNLRNGYHNEISFRQTYYSGKRTFTTTLSYERRQHQVAQAMSYDQQTGVYTYRPENVDGNWNAYGNLYYGFSIPKTNFYVSGNTRAYYNNSVDLISPDGIHDAVRSTVGNTQAEQKLSVSYNIRKITASIGADVTLEHATSERQNFNDRTTFDYRYSASFTANQFWKGLSFSTNLALRQLRGYDDPTMNDNTLIWDAQLSRSFGRQKQWGLMLKGHDLLRQVSNIRRSINAQGLTETWVNSLPAHVMLHVTYRWNKNPKTD